MRYRLFSVVNHKGKEMSKGHYVCYTLDSDNEWIFFDDNKQRKASRQAVTESEAYLLFYELII